MSENERVAGRQGQGMCSADKFKRLLPPKIRLKAAVIPFPAGRIHRYSTPDGMVNGPARSGGMNPNPRFRGEEDFY
jgi:hypothetical protein